METFLVIAEFFQSNLIAVLLNFVAVAVGHYLRDEEGHEYLANMSKEVKWVNRRSIEIMDFYLMISRVF